MERWESSQQGEESEEKKIRRKKMQVREKVGKSRNIVFFFRGFVAPEGRKVGSLKRRVRRHLGRWKMKSCTPLWREANFEVKRYKTRQRRTTLASWDVENVLKTVSLGTLLDVEMSKKCTALWREAHLDVKSVKNWRSRTTFGSWDVEKVHGVVVRSTFQSQSVKNWGSRRHFGRSDVVLRGIGSFSYDTPTSPRLVCICPNNIKHWI